MNWVFSLGWLAKSLIAMFSIIPLVMLSAYFRSKGVKFEGILLGWLIGSAVGIFSLSINGIGEMSLKNLYSPFVPIAIAIVGGFTFGTLTNVLVVSAMFDHSVPNPALPYVIFGINPAISYLAVSIAAVMAPQIFKEVAGFDWSTLVGVILVVIGVSIIVYRN